MMKRTIAVIALGLVLAASARAQSPQGEGPTTETIARNCMGCHGPDGKSPGKVPVIAGKPADELAKKMEEFRDGKRESTMMHRLMKGFADDDIRKLAEYFASKK